MTHDDVKQLVTELLTAMGLSVNVEVTQDGDFFSINLTGEDTGILERGKENRTGALVTVLKLMIKQKFQQEPKLVVDINGQRQTRISNMVQMAKKKAEMVRITGMDEEMPPMTPAERRAVHMALKEMVGVKTESRGTEPHRRIVIINDDTASVL